MGVWLSSKAMLGVLLGNLPKLKYTSMQNAVNGGMREGNELKNGESKALGQDRPEKGWLASLLVNEVQLGWLFTIDMA